MAKPIDPKNIIQSADIPSIPSVLQEILALADNPKTTAADLERIVSQEPALVAQLLKWVNSAFYSLPRRVSSVSHAMILLGFSTVKSIASGMVLINAFDGISGLTPKYVNTIWQHTLVAANLIKIFAKKESTIKQDDLFLSAMIHDVGYLVLKQYFGKKYDEVLDNTDFPEAEKENEVLGTNHIDIGVALLEEWKFPETVIQMVKYHHTDEAEDFVGDDIDLKYLRLCDILAYEKDLEVLLEEYLATEDENFRPDLIEAFDAIGWDKALLENSQENITTSVKMVAQIIK